MVEKAKIFYFSVFVLVVFAFIFHINAMGFHHWKKATAKTPIGTGFNYTTIGLFTRCVTSNFNQTETCFPNLYPGNTACTWDQCIARSVSDSCQCDFLPSTKGIASCAIIAAVFLGLAIIILFIHSIKTTTETRAIGLCLSFFPLFLLLLAFIFILIALILVGSYLSRDIMYTLRTSTSTDLGTLRTIAAGAYDIRVDWSTGLEIIALIFTFFSFLLYSLFVFKLGRSS